MSSSEVVRTDAAQRVAELLKTAAKPRTFTQLKTDSHLDEAGLKNALEQAVSRGDVFRWPDYARRQYFWSQSPEVAAQQTILEIASKSALTRANLFVEVRKRVQGFSRAAFEPIVANFLSEKQLQSVPAFTSGKLLIKSGAVEAYAAGARAFVEKRFRKAGFEPLAWPASPAGEPSVDAAALILEAVRSLEPVTGVPVSAQRLRNHLPSLSKTEFDDAALELRKRLQVFLSLDHDPHNLSQPERDLLIDGRDGTYYVAIAIR
jgi:hypothetical protein